MMAVAAFSHACLASWDKIGRAFLYGTILFILSILSFAGDYRTHPVLLDMAGQGPAPFEHQLRRLPLINVSFQRKSEKKIYGGFPKHAQWSMKHRNISCPSPSFLTRSERNILFCFVDSGSDTMLCILASVMLRTVMGEKML